MKISVKDLKGNSQGEIEVGFAVIENGKGTQAVHDTVTAFRAAQRSGTACTKTAGEVAGSNKKPWRQKGTGRARAGSVRSPLWRGGGVVFGPKPRDFSKTVSAKTRALSLRKAMSERLKAGDILVVEELKVATHKTKDFLKILTGLQITGTTLLVNDTVDKNLTLASRNVPKVELTTSDTLNTYQVLKSDKLVFSKSAFEKVGARLAND